MQCIDTTLEGTLCSRDAELDFNGRCKQHAGIYAKKLLPTMQEQIELENVKRFERIARELLGNILINGYLLDCENINYLVSQFSTTYDLYENVNESPTEEKLQIHFRVILNSTGFDPNDVQLINRFTSLYIYAVSIYKDNRIF